MPEAYIVGAVRTPVGTRKGALAAVHPADLGAHVLRELMQRTGVDPSAVDDVVMGCVNAMGPQSGCIARTSWLSAGLPQGVPGVTIDRQCGSAQQALHFAAQGVMSGTQDLVVAAGVENMAMVPIDANRTMVKQLGANPYGVGWNERYADEEISQFRGAQLICEKWDLSREDLERFSLQSHQRAVAAIDDGRFVDQIAPLGEATTDEGARRDTSLEKMATLAPLREGWAVTAAVASQISVGAGALLVASEEAVRTHNLTPLARVHALSVVGDDPVFMLTGPIPATQHALKRSGLTIDDIDAFEINEAFAPVVLAWARETGASLEKTNINGGAIALGHPLGATGAILATKLIYELQRTGGRYGLQSMCEGGGQANATIIERL
ncbi:MAG: acetyl-CoA C-acetyltransferase [Pseudonocardiales bacterium]|nr:acetyl-CoA C-acetyltransferase [Pseudonocardiales bacterium]MDT7589385.1 acetyl-CoA C-acetyltransferase [Pseudonocardiales bacterium]MDT7620183.1 acetyl-CoA C-acetyltransferase [Pseudonocardiales bacterium]MDT7774774.1 acetyl-CoA C-acetyltransferase [Pseudonocardiales bacterium]